MACRYHVASGGVFASNVFSEPISSPFAFRKLAAGSLSSQRSRTVAKVAVMSNHALGANGDDGRPCHIRPPDPPDQRGFVGVFRQNGRAVA